MEEWYRNIRPLNRKEDPVQCSIAIGLAYGVNSFDINTLMKTMDDAMYENKKAMKAERID